MNDTALQMADELDSLCDPYDSAIATELRRLHAENEQLRTDRDNLRIEMLKKGGGKKMNNNTGGAAFPHHIEHPNGHWPVITHAGMTLRDWMAGMAMQGICASGPGISNLVIASEAYALADAMLKAREASNG